MTDLNGEAASVQDLRQVGVRRRHLGERLRRLRRLVLRRAARQLLHAKRKRRFEHRRVSESACSLPDSTILINHMCTGGIQA